MGVAVPNSNTLRMDQDPQLAVSQDLQRALLTAEFVTKGTNSEQDDGDNDLFELDPQIFDRWVPLLRQTIDESQLNTVVDDLYGSIDDHFENLEVQILQDTQLNNNLVTSINEIQKVQGIIDGSLQNDIHSLQKQVRSSTLQLVSKKQILIDNIKTSSKIKESSILIQKVLQIMELFNRCRELIEENDFFKALQTMETFETIYLQDFKQYNFEFLTEIYTSIPTLKSQIKDESINLIKNSLNYNLEKSFGVIGDKYYNVYETQILQDWLKTKQAMKLHSYKFNSPVEISLRDASRLDPLQLQNFCQLHEFHDSILIFQSLGEMNFFIDEFRKEYEFRKSKLVHPLFLKDFSTVSHSDGNTDLFAEKLNLPFFKEYILKILGFLVYDKELHRSTDYVLSNNSFNSTDVFWTSIMNKLYPYLITMVKNTLINENLLTAFKDFLGVLIAILENLKLNVELLYKVQVETFNQYCDLLVFQFEKEFTNLLQDDDFMPLSITDKTLYHKILKICWLTDHGSDANPSNDSQFSATFPFSPLYPMTCTLVKKTYTSLHSFISVFYKHDISHLNLILVKAIDSIFDKVVNLNIKSKLDTTSREEIAQILVNLDYFVIATKEFSLILTRENLTNNPDVEIRLSSIKKLIETRKEAETKLINLIDSKVIDLMEFIEFDWNTIDIRDEPDMTIVDIAQFLEMMFTSTLAIIPSNIKMLLIFREFDVITRRFLEKLLNETPNRISPQSVQNFETDMLYLEKTISKIFPNDVSSVPSSPSIPLTPTDIPSTAGNRSSVQVGNNIKSLLSTFTDLKQHIGLMKVNHWEEYKDNDIRLKKYSRVKPEVAQSLLAKLQPPSSEQSNLISDEGSSADSRGNSRFAKLFSRS
ncbi:unnamed protein product [Kluyveromyces dobzhanskii CBS 2104]|uniref:Exocyst complex component SEC15 n=1 Tax=Kluyveromyces dobzhanskii CBS 2104 TaxID=1427455 RepID=A0A0A8KYY2_9SACH|nr:unnamed protein product [Kluyveromyces dobzhanskii CBS 2104]